MKFVNLMPSPLHLSCDESAHPGCGILVIAPEGQVACCECIPLREGTLCGMPLHRSCLTGRILGLPDPAPDTLYIVSPPVALLAAIQGRTDVVAPADPDSCSEEGVVRGWQQSVPESVAWRERSDAATLIPSAKEF